MSDRESNILNADEAAPIEQIFGRHWGAAFTPLTPYIKQNGGTLGVNMMRVPPGRAVVPFHTHLREDEAFYVLSGRGVLRYGEALSEIGPGDCISCPADSGVAHQICNPFDEELVYLAIGHADPHEVCTYPDTGKVSVRGIKTIGRLEQTEYLDGEPEKPKIFELFEAKKSQL